MLVVPPRAIVKKNEIETKNICDATHQRIENVKNELFPQLLKLPDEIKIKCIEKNDDNKKTVDIDLEYIEKTFSFGTVKQTNNVAELTAVGLAVDLCEQFLQQPQQAHRNIIDVFVMTDSKYVHGLLQLKWTAKENVELVRNLRLRLKKFVTTYHVRLQFHWIRAHNSIVGNEKVDQLAKAAANEGLKLSQTENNNNNPFPRKRKIETKTAAPVEYVSSSSLLVSQAVQGTAQLRS